MTYQETLDALLAARIAQINAQYDADMAGVVEYDRIDGPRLHYHGTAMKVHPDLAEEYPDGWPLFLDETIDQALRKTHLILALTHKP